MFIQRSIVPLLTAALLVAMAGCGGSNSAAPLVPVGAPSAPAGAQGTARLTIFIPAAKAAALQKLSSHTLRPAYISPSTQSLAITIMSGGVPTLTDNVSLAVGSNPNCATVLGGIQCTISLGLTSGSYQGTFIAYDGPIVSNAPTGNILAEAQLPPVFTISAGQTTNIQIPLDGVPASIVLTPASGSTIVGSTYGGYTLQSTAQAMTVTAYDADGNVITGTGAPVLTAAATGGIAVTSPAPGNPSQILLSGTSGQSGKLTITAAPPRNGYSCSSSGVVCTATASLSTWPHHLFVANGSSLSVYSTSDDVNWSLLTTNSNSNLTSATALAVGPSGTVFMLTSPSLFTYQLSILASPYTGTPTVNTSGISSPRDLKVTSGGTVLIADGSNIDEFASPWTGTPTHISATSAAFLALDSSDDAITTAGGGGPTVLHSAPSYTSNTTISSSLGKSVAFGPDNTLFVGDFNTHAVYVYAPPYTGTPVTLTLPLEGGAQMVPSSLAVDNNGNIWILAAYGGTCPCNDYLFEFTRPFSGNETPSLALTPTPSSINAEALAEDASGDVLFPQTSSVLVISSSGSTTATITSGVANPRNLFYTKY